MKIVSFEAENFKRLRAVHIRPDGHVVTITGENGQGKSSVLDAILAALGGEREIQMVPIRKGTEQGLIKLDLGDYRVTRTFKDDDAGGYTTNLKLETAEGARVPGQQGVLKAMIGDLAFNPGEFERMKAADQFETLKGFVPGVDFAGLAAADKEDYDARTTHNRKAKELRAQADAYALPAGPVPKRVDVAPLEAKLAEAGTRNAEIAARKARREALADTIALQATTIERLSKELADLRLTREANMTTLASAEELPEPTDTAAVQAALADARRANDAATFAEAKADLAAKAQAEEAQALTLTKRLETREDERHKAIAAAKMPVDGLGFGDGYITLGGVPFDQASHAQRLRASLAIAAALNPKLRVILVHDASRFDKHALAELAAFAEAQDLQVWMEVVGEGPTGFILEDGSLKGDEAATDEAI